MHLHLLLVSDQILPNLIPVLMERPERVVLVSTPEMTAKGQGKRLETLLRQQGIAVELEASAPAVNMVAIQHYALDLAGRIETSYPAARLTLNATGGTKLMALGFVDVFRGLAQRILYTDTAHRRIEFLPDAQGLVAPAQPMTDVLKVPDYLAAQGFRYASAVSDDPAWRERAATRKAACKYFGKHAHALGDFIGVLNALANQALEPVPNSHEERLAYPRQTLHHQPRGSWATAMSELVKARLIDWRHGDLNLEFRDLEAARFVRGGWLEEYAWHGLKDARVFDVRLGVTGHWSGARQSINEFDVLACHGNQLLFIECKTKRFQDAQNDNDLTYKLDSLSQDARGLFGATWLLTARQPTEVQIERARTARIRILGAAALPQWREVVQQWMQAPAL